MNVPRLLMRHFHEEASTAGQRPVEASTLPVSDKPVTLSFRGGLSGKQGPIAGSMTVPPAKKPAVLPTAFQMSEDAFPEEEVDDEQQNNTSEDPKVSASKKVAPLIASKKVVSNINKWNQVQEVLSHDVERPAPAETPTALPVESAVKAKSATPAPADDDVDFSDSKAMTCLLCARQFKSQEQLKRHTNDEKRNLKDVNLREIAREKAAAARKKADQPRYRDRASERRVMHNQPDAPLPTELSKSTGKRKQAEGPPRPPTPPPPPVNPGQDENNVGNKLLKMMGWKEGTGLGTDGEGRVDPVQTAIYAQGVGLGASKGKEVGKYAEGYSGYVHMAQDAARERYGS
ncbi:uncharacterized protein FIBRA_09009 [Fibroporia radiculosa]|uniref:G-patch domain-containing protein n=1 Tax=Fibroporia radiculosa TaxID=599839 RepID=J4GIP8_9APHY|nr:uncharacterized protein FIBRA_09009 [Fibroporia radiculosa]CCM06718.1 predicted protein [Fibroporia radiculosa]